MFASKYVGEGCARFIFERKDNILQLYVGCEDDLELIQMAQNHEVPVAVWTEVSRTQFIENKMQYDWLLNFWCPHILRENVLSKAVKRLNVHPGLVPHCRGNDGAAWALRLKVPAGVSLIEMTEQIDAGGIYAQREVPYKFGETGRSLHNRLQDEAVSLFQEAWPGIVDGEIEAGEQPEGGSYFTRKMTNTDRVQSGDTRFTLEEFVRWSTSHDFSPGTTAEIIADDGRHFRVTVEEIKS